MVEQIPLKDTVGGSNPSGCTMNTPANHAVFQIGLKVLLRKGGKVPFLKDSETGHLDLPGGRIDESESSLPLFDIIAREIQEELGKDIQYKVGAPLFQYRRNNKQHAMPVFITVYDAEHISGEITLSEEHTSCDWLDPKTIAFQESDFGNTEEADTVNNYFKSLQP